MLWLMKVSESVGQHRITIPKEFCKKHGITDKDYLVIDDRDPDGMTIGRFVHGTDKKTESN